MLHQVGVSFDLYYDARKHKKKPQLGYHNTQETIPIIKTRNKRHLRYNNNNNKMNNIYLNAIGFSPGGSTF